MKAKIGDYVTLVHGGVSSFGSLNSRFLYEEGYDSSVGVPVTSIVKNTLFVELPSGYVLGIKESDIKNVLNNYSKEES